MKLNAQGKGKSLGTILFLIVMAGVLLPPVAEANRKWKLVSSNKSGKLEKRVESTWLTYKECLEARKTFLASNQATGRTAVCD